MENKKVKIKIKHWITSKVLFEYYPRSQPKRSQPKRSKILW